jgi:SAM-dependent methyltransferase
MIQAQSISQDSPQNIYDNPAFFAGYKNLRQNDTGLNGALEVPALCRLLPDLHGRQVLDLGCGFGDFARYAHQAGAASITALDVSEKMLAEARLLTSDPAITYVHCAIEDYVPQPRSFDLVVSSMALHYVADYRTVALRMFDAIQPGGRFVFSVEHPVCTANPIGWVANERGEALYWPLDHYRQEGRRNTKWFIDGVVKYHRTVATYVNTLLSIGFQMENLDEPMPADEVLALRPELQVHSRRPPILLLAASRI